ncbi:hypothetical protein M3221_18535 [Domibacillus indicus]|uniref:hypothetical protein n=1 Tax=Domibacillus indicus TaxID=1437523 RepID=UPI00203C3A27|nr:hypothetical protein [Domibacillus indicus]MCM3790376.1 hypothetical protein [Domibacillus indicus]
MKVVKSLLHKITNQTEIFNSTLDIYNDALSFIIRVIDKEFDNTDNLTTKSIVPAVEKLIQQLNQTLFRNTKSLTNVFISFRPTSVEVPLLLLLAK